MLPAPQSRGAEQRSTLYYDVGALLDGGIPDPPEPTVMRTAGGYALFYDSQVNLLFGDPESAQRKHGGGITGRTPADGAAAGTSGASTARRWRPGRAAGLLGAVWADADLFAALMRRHGFPVERTAADPCVRFVVAVEAWAEKHGVLLPTDQGDRVRSADWRRLRAEFGIRPCRRLRAVA